ncbi:MAG: hypothetical protein M3384_17295 [Acidobacteriota bacterium]|nr:hypothetical protein [Acidobacteriota bacterium]
MIIKFISLFLISLLFNFSAFTTAKANSNPEKEAKLAAKVKNGIGQLGSGKEVQVKVKMKDGRKLNGYVSEVNDDSFIVIDNLNMANTIQYSGVRQVTGKNNLTGKEIAIVAAAILLLILIAASGVV